MAPARPQRKLPRRKPAARSSLRGLAIAFALATGGFPATAIAATTERIVTDWHTGLALYGYDPVGYFTDAAPVMGRAGFEYSFGGAIWRFRNEGNRAAFMAHTEIYMPRYGGYDPIAVARGVPTRGNPTIWVIDRARLYLFANAGSRNAFVADPEKAAEEAESRWPGVVRELAQ
jgi:hypothetical protein